MRKIMFPVTSETGGKEAGHNFWKNDIVRGHNINQLESNGSRMADKSTSTRPWSSISKLNDTPRGAMTVPRYHQKVFGDPTPGNLHPFPKIVGIIFPFISLWITQPVKANHVTFSRSLNSQSVMAHTLSMECVSLRVWIHLLLTYHFVSHWILSTMRHQEPELN